MYSYLLPPSPPLLTNPENAPRSFVIGFDPVQPAVTPADLSTAAQWFLVTGRRVDGLIH